MDENQVRSIIKEELANFSPQKKKRAPNKWQQFLKDCTKRQPEELVYTDKVKLCSIEYKDAKNSGNIDKLLTQKGNVQDDQTQNAQNQTNNNNTNTNNNTKININNNRKNIRQIQEEPVEIYDNNDIV